MIVVPVLLEKLLRLLCRFLAIFLIRKFAAALSKKISAQV